MKDQPFPPKLVRRAIEGDAEAQEVLAPALINHLQRAVRTIQLDGRWQFIDREDVVQDVALKVLEQLHQCRNAEKFKGWVNRIFWNHIRDLGRKHKVIEQNIGPRTSLDEPLWEGDEGEQLTLADTLSDTDGRETIIAEIDGEDDIRMNPKRLVHQFLGSCKNAKHVNVFTLKHCMGWKQREIAAHYSMSIGAVGSILKRMQDEFRLFVKTQLEN